MSGVLFSSFFFIFLFVYRSQCLCWYEICKITVNAAMWVWFPVTDETHLYPCHHVLHAPLRAAAVSLQVRSAQVGNVLPSGKDTSTCQRNFGNSCFMALGIYPLNIAFTTAALELSVVVLVIAIASDLVRHTMRRLAVILWCSEILGLWSCEIWKGLILTEAG